MSPRSSTFLRSARSQAFSLVEVAMAVGVFAFAMVGIMGLLPVGMTSFRDSKARAVETAIMQQRSSELLQTPFNILAAPGTSSHTAVTGLQFYSEEGVRIGDVRSWNGGASQLSPSSYAAGAVFASTVTVAPSLNIGSTSSSNVVRAVIEISRVSTPGRSLKTPIYVPNLGK